MDMVLTSTPKAKAIGGFFPSPRTVVSPQLTEGQQLAQWLERGQAERFIIETEVTPEMAQLLLDRNPDNRILREPKVAEYAAAMARGEWKLNGETIIIAASGELNDGQKRLSAIIEAGVSAQMTLYFGLTRESRSTVDVGDKRTLADHFKMAQFQNSNGLAAAVRLLWNYDGAVYSLSHSPSVEQAFECVRRNPRIADYLSMGARIGTAFSTSGAQLAFAGYVCSRINQSVADELMARTLDGLGLTSAGVPAARVRERLMQHLIGKVVLRRNEPAAVFIKAFNGARCGRRLRALSWSATGPTGEPFPIAGE